MNDTRNVIDHFKYWTEEAILAELDKKRHNYSVLISNKFNDFNIGTVIRNSNAFLAKEVIVYGKKRFDRRGTVGTHLYTNLKYLRETDSLDFNGAMVVGIDNIPGAIPIEEYKWNYDKHTILAFGQESIGLPQKIIDICHEVVYITQYGSVRSLNVGCASAIAMYDYCTKQQFLESSF